MSSFTLLPDGNGSSPRSWTSQSYLDIDEGISGADGTAIAAANGTNNNDTSFTLANLGAASINAVISLSFNVRYRQQNRSNDTLGLQIRVMSGATVLAAANSGGTFQSVAAGITTTSFTDSGPVAFSYVNGSATLTQWNAATVELRQTYSATGGSDNAHVEVDALELAGVYVVFADLQAADAAEIKTWDTDSDTALPVWCPLTGSTALLSQRGGVRLVSVVNDTITNETEVALAAFAATSMARMDDTTAVILERDIDTGDTVAELATVSGTTLTVGSLTTIVTGIDNARVTSLDATHALAWWASGADLIAVVLTVSGGSISVGATNTVITGDANAQSFWIAGLSATKAFLAYKSLVAPSFVDISRNIAVLAISGSTITAGTVSTTNNATFVEDGARRRSDTSAWLMIGTGSSWQIASYDCSGSSPTSLGTSGTQTTGLISFASIDEGNCLTTFLNGSTRQAAIFNADSSSISKGTSRDVPAGGLPVCAALDNGHTVYAWDEGSPTHTFYDLCILTDLAVLVPESSAVPPLRIRQRDDNTWTPRIKRSTARQDTPRVGRNSYW